jgi:hypothetical protein
MKVGILPESILPKMLVDRLVLKGAVLQARLGGREGGAHPVAQACNVVQLSSISKKKLKVSLPFGWYKQEHMRPALSSIRRAPLVTLPLVHVIF